MARVVVLTGAFGSGKTEIAINLALRWARRDEDDTPGRVALVDLDVVTPYFRSRDLSNVLSEFGVELVSPLTYGRYSEPTALTPAILGAIQDTSRTVVIDVGGDPAGAHVLARYSGYLAETDHELNLVVNPRRPATATVDGVVRMAREIEAASRLRFAGLISNPNLMADTTTDTIREGHEVVLQAAARLGLPVRWLCIAATHARGRLTIDPATPLLLLKRYLLPVWESEGGGPGAAEEGAGQANQRGP